uniref:Uncharacterized protein n=2 Tax=Ixodes scapularis TaxID=6945 RepID=A0A1S4L3Z5_IXOSC
SSYPPIGLSFAASPARHGGAIRVAETSSSQLPSPSGVHRRAILQPSPAPSRHRLAASSASPGCSSSSSSDAVGRPNDGRIFSLPPPASSGRGPPVPSSRHVISFSPSTGQTEIAT